MIPRPRLVRNLIVSTFLMGCGSSSNDPEIEEDPPKEPVPIVIRGPASFQTYLNCPKGTYLTYENFGAAFLSTFCLTCHSQKRPEGQRGGAPLGANFDTAHDAERYIAAMLSKTQGNSPPMPPGQPLKARDKEAFAEWLNCGAPRKNSQ